MWHLWHQTLPYSKHIFSTSPRECTPLISLLPLLFASPFSILMNKKFEHNNMELRSKLMYNAVKTQIWNTSSTKKKNPNHEIKYDRKWHHITKTQIWINIQWPNTISNKKMLQIFITLFKNWNASGSATTTALLVICAMSSALLANFT